MKKLWIYNNDWLCFHILSQAKPCEGCHDEIVVSNGLAERILAAQNEMRAIQGLVNKYFWVSDGYDGSGFEPYFPDAEVEYEQERSNPIGDEEQVRILREAGFSMAGIESNGKE